MSKNIRAIAVDLLLRVEEEKAYSNLLLNSVLNQVELSKADRALFTEIVYGTISMRDRLDYVIRQYLKGSSDRLEKWVLILLRLSFYQLLFLDRIPEYAVVHEAVNIAKRRGHPGISRMVNGILRSYLREPHKAEIPSQIKGVKRIALEYSHPDWLVERWTERYGSEVAEKICAANNRPHAISIRVNSLRTDRTQLLEKLLDQGIEAELSEISSQGLRLSSGGNPAHMQEYADGLFSIQDESSMLVAELLDVKPGMRVLDACAAPGGKTAHIAELMKNRGEIIANDLHPHKERLILDQGKRLGVTIIKTAVGDALTIPERIEGQFDRILLDAPCSGFGVIRRKPDLKWSKKPQDVKAIANLQYEMLTALAPLLKSGGKLIYSTCTILPEENEDLIERFLAENPQFRLDEAMVADLSYDHLKEIISRPGQMQILPHYWETDGFFIARLMRA